VKLNIEENKLQIKLNPLEIVLSLRGSLRVPLDHITQVSTKRPEREWKQIRAPGAHIPFLLKAGTYHGGRGKEFWQTTLGKPFLTIELRDWDYNRIVLTLGDNKAWEDRINQAVQSMAESVN